jgi:group I intron endonuclease
MITYIPINLSNRKFYIGSTVDFDRRWDDHLKSSCNYPFQNSLRNNPQNFFVLISEDDGADNREEEQFYLDFYHGSEWCYNLSLSATAPMSGRKHTEETLEKMKGHPFTKEMVQKRKETWDKKYGGHPSAGKEGCWKDKQRPEHSRKMSGEGNPMYGVRLVGQDNPAFGRKWWVNSEGNTVFQEKPPGKDWQNGKKWKP